MALTFDSAKGILWSIVRDELDQRRLEYTPNESAGTFTLGNGSVLKFFGVNSNFKEMYKVLGQKYIEVGIDEAGSMTVDMDNLVHQKLFAATTDLGGSITLLGTPENIPRTFFQEVTDGKSRSLPWTVHKWTTEDNPYMRENFINDRQLILDSNPLAANASWFKTHWLNQWCADDDLLIYHIKEHNFTNISPTKPMYVIGIDLGYNDDASFVVTAWSFNDPNLYVIKAFKEPGLDITDTADRIKTLLRQFHDAKLIVDGSNKQAVEEMKKRHGLPLEGADKTGKASFMRMMADDLKQGRILIHRSECQAIINEAEQLMWVKGEDKEDDRCANHAMDALLYNWRYAKNYTFKPEMSTWKDTNKVMEELFKEEGKRLEEEQRELSNW